MFWSSPESRRRGSGRLLSALLVAECVASVQGASSKSERPAGQCPGPEAKAGYTGSASCRECHERFFQLWAPSHHGLAMQPWSIAKTNLTEPKHEIQIGPEKFRVEIAGGAMLGRGPSGEKRYPIEQAMGGKNVLYFLTPFPGRRLQVLPLAYDLRRKEWYDTAASAVRHFPMQPDRALHWTDRAYTFNTACFNCHVSQLTNHYDLKGDAYSTAWGEPGINCETCHGPASEHVRAARLLPKGQPMQDLKLISFRSFTPEQANAACGSCHAKMSPLSSSFVPGDRFFDHFTLVGLEEPDFYPDGRDLGENFTMTSWLLSPCQQSGKLDCIKCHTSSGRYRFNGEHANDACLPCHQEKVSRVADHSHHAAGTPGAQCVSCHMPMTEFARMRRSDHSMRPPMPAATLAFGSPNACNLCHTNKDAAWADQQVRQWHSIDYQAPLLRRANWIAAARKHDWSRLDEILKYIASPQREEVWAASLLQLLRPCDDERKLAPAITCLKDRSPLVRAAAIDVLADQLRPEHRAALLAATRDPSRLVRVRAAAALAALPCEGLDRADEQSLDAAIAEMLASLKARPDDPASYHNLGNFYLERRELPEAVAAFQTGIKLEPDNVASLVNLSLAYNLAGSNQLAEASLRRALNIEPTNSAVHLNLGMLLAEMGRPSGAEEAFRAAFKADPKSAPAAFNLGVLLAKDHPEEALTWCARAVQLRPQEARYAYTLAFYQHQQGKTDDAARTLEKLIAQVPPPTEPDAYLLLGQIYEKKNQSTQALSVYRRAAANNRLSQPDRSHFEARIGNLQDN